MAAMGCGVAFTRADAELIREAWQLAILGMETEADKVKELQAESERQQMAGVQPLADAIRLQEMWRAETEQLRAILASAPEPTSEHAWLLKYVDWWKRRMRQAGTSEKR